MTKRYYISRRIGSGTREDPYTSELRNYIYANWPNEPHFLQQVIAHVIPWCAHKYNLSDACHDDIMINVPDIFDFPAGALDRPLSEIPAAKRQAIRQKLENIGFDFSWATLDNTVRDVLVYLFCSIQLAEWADVQIGSQNFDLNKTVADVPVTKRQLVSQRLQDLGIPTGWITLDTTIKQILNKAQYLDDGVTKRLFGTVRRRQWFYHDEDTE